MVRGFVEFVCEEEMTGTRLLCTWALWVEESPAAARCDAFSRDTFNKAFVRWLGFFVPDEERQARAQRPGPPGQEAGKET